MANTLALPQRGQWTPSGQRRSARNALQSSSVWNRATNWENVMRVFMARNIAFPAHGVNTRIIALAMTARFCCHCERSEAISMELGSFRTRIMASTLPRIAVIGTGGTISSLGASSMDVLDYPDFGQKLSSEGLIDRFPETRLVAEPVPVTFRQVGSTAIGPAEWLELRNLIHRTAERDPGIAGF